MIRGYSDNAANERTFLAWVRTGIAVIAFGFVIEKFNLFVLTMANANSLIVVGMMMANICVEATACCGAELGCHVILVRDATAAFSAEAMHAAHEINGPTFAHAILTTEAVIAALGKT